MSSGYNTYLSNKVDIATQIEELKKSMVHRCYCQSSKTTLQVILYHESSLPKPEIMKEVLDKVYMTLYEFVLYIKKF